MEEFTAEDVCARQLGDLLKREHIYKAMAAPNLRRNFNARSKYKYSSPLLLFPNLRTNQTAYIFDSQNQTFVGATNFGNLNIHGLGSSTLLMSNSFKEDLSPCCGSNAALEFGGQPNLVPIHKVDPLEIPTLANLVPESGLSYDDKRTFTLRPATALVRGIDSRVIVLWRKRDGTPMTWTYEWSKNFLDLKKPRQITPTISRVLPKAVEEMQRMIIKPALNRGVLTL